MKAFCIVSARKNSGKTYISSIFSESLTSIGVNVCYYKPFIMNVTDGKPFDTEYIKKTTNLNVADIYTSYAFNAVAPMFPIFNNEDINISERDITDLIEEASYKYDIMILETLAIYDPIKENYTFLDLLNNIPKYIQKSAVIVSPYDENVIDSTLYMIESLHTKKIKTSMVIINQMKDVLIDNNIIEYIKKQIEPVKIFCMDFNKNAGSEKIKEPENKYSDILDHFLLS